jgi:hypothetical protein
MQHTSKSRKFDLIFYFYYYYFYFVAFAFVSESEGNTMKSCDECVTWAASDTTLTMMVGATPVLRLRRSERVLKGVA